MDPSEVGPAAAAAAAWAAATRRDSLVHSPLSAIHHVAALRIFVIPLYSAQDHQEFINKYADYLAQKVYVFKLLGVSVERRPPTESKEWARKLSGFDLVKALPALSQQFDRLLLCAPYGGDVMALAIPVAALQLLVRDAFRIYSVLTVLMLGVVDHYLELDAPQTKLILSVCTAFKSQNTRFKRWTQQLAAVGFAHDKLFPDLVPIPDALFELLQDHMIAKGGVRPAPAAAAAASPAAQPGRKAAPAAAAGAGKKAAPAAAAAGARKKPAGRAAAGGSSSEDPMDSSSEDEEVAPVRRKAAAMAVSKKPAAAAPALTKKQQAAAAAAAAAEEEESEDDDESEDEEDAAAAAAEAARKAAKKARKEERRLKREAKAAKKAAKLRAAQQEEEESSEEEEEDEPAPAPVVVPAKKSKKAAAAAAAPSGEIDLFAVLDAPVSARPAQPAYPVPAAAPSPYAAAAYPPAAGGYPVAPAASGYNPYGGMAPPPNAFSPYGGNYGSYPVPQSQHLYGQQPPQPFGAAAALSQLQPLASSSSSGRAAAPRARAASLVPGEDNTTAVGGVYDPNASASADPFADVAPNLSSAQPKGKSRR